jgi:hypothetical protein
MRDEEAWCYDITTGLAVDIVILVTACPSRGIWQQFGKSLTTKWNVSSKNKLPDSS